MGMIAGGSVIKSIQNVQASMVSVASLDVTISQVNMSKAVVIWDGASNNNNTSTNDNGMWAKVTFLDATTLRFEKNQATITLNHALQVIEYM